MNNYANRNAYMYDGHKISSTEETITTIAENNKCLTFLVEQYFHPKVICSDQGGDCVRLQDTILFLSRNQKQEEFLMEETGYPDLDAHRKGHETILRNLETLKRTYVCGSYDNDLVFDFIMEWAENHTRFFDKHFSDFLKKQKIEIFKGEDF